MLGSETSPGSEMEGEMEGWTKAARVFKGRRGRGNELWMSDSPKRARTLRKCREKAGAALSKLGALYWWTSGAGWG